MHALTYPKHAFTHFVLRDLLWVVLVVPSHRRFLAVMERLYMHNNCFLCVLSAKPPELSLEESIHM